MNNELLHKYLDSKFDETNKRIEVLAEAQGEFRKVLVGESGANGLVGTQRKHSLYWSILLGVSCFVVTLLTPTAIRFTSEKFANKPATAGVQWSK